MWCVSLCLHGLWFGIPCEASARLREADSDQVCYRFNGLGRGIPPHIGTLADALVDLKEHQEKLETVLKGILANSQADVCNTQETLSQISKTRLSFAHLVDNLESMRNLSAHIDEELSALKKEFKVLNRPGTNISCKGSVDTTINSIDTMVQNKGRNVKKRSSSVDTSPGQVDTTSSQVDTRDLSQGINCQSGTVCRHTSWAGRHTPESL
ncbi:hypothetical protein Taro_014607 [Colocasia esculenta]|uniref:Uncharacterized protein n=1 Tax=Colocasia esculenta TaxID=4460 RepID=A0A843UMC0_COLES|nr:hypothetical protein [Colocasia esculenta]